jgi:hypothetical protein
MDYLGWSILAVVLFPTLMMVIDACVSYRRKGGDRSGISGFRRATIALTVILILGLAIFHLLNDTNGVGSNEAVKGILNMLAGLVAAIAGFYFGGRFSEKRTEEADARAAKLEARLGELEATLTPRGETEKEGNLEGG